MDDQKLVTFVGWHLDLALLPHGECFFQKQAHSMENQGLAVSTLCGWHVDSSGQLPVATGSPAGSGH